MGRAVLPPPQRSLHRSSKLQARRPEGTARIAIEGGPTLDLGVGDIASLPKGAVTTWELTLPYKEMWFFGRPYEAAAAED